MTTEREKHFVVVDESHVQTYLAKGYARSDESLVDHLGEQAWMQLQKEERVKLVLMEIDKAEHEQKQRLPQKFMVETDHGFFVHTARATRFDVLETDVFDSVIADANRDTGVRRASNDGLFETARQAANASRGRILDQIELHRAAADRLEDFLRKHECL